MDFNVAGFSKRCELPQNRFSQRAACSLEPKDARDRCGDLISCRAVMSLEESQDRSLDFCWRQHLRSAETRRLHILTVTDGNQFALNGQKTSIATTTMGRDQPADGLHYRLLNPAASTTKTPKITHPNHYFIFMNWAFFFDYAHHNATHLFNGQFIRWVSR